MNVNQVLLAEIGKAIKDLQLQLDYERARLISVIGGEPIIDGDSITVASGNVGVGTNNPGNLLSLNTPSTDDTIPALGVNGGKFGIFRNMNYGMIMGQLSSGDGFVQVQRIDGTATAYGLLLQPNGGRVGIGTTSPNEKLTVAGVLSITDGTTAPATTSGYAKIYVDLADGDLKIKFSDGTVKTIVTDS